VFVQAAAEGAVVYATEEHSIHPIFRGTRESVIQGAGTNGRT